MSAAFCDRCNKLIDCDLDPEAPLAVPVMYHGKQHDFLCAFCRDALEFALEDRPPVSGCDPDWDSFASRMETEAESFNEEKYFDGDEGE